MRRCLFSVGLLQTVTVFYGNKEATEKITKACRPAEFRFKEDGSIPDQSGIRFSHISTGIADQRNTFAYGADYYAEQAGTINPASESHRGFTASAVQTFCVKQIRNFLRPYVEAGRFRPCATCAE